MIISHDACAPLPRFFVLYLPLPDFGHAISPKPKSLLQPGRSPFQIPCSLLVLPSAVIPVSYVQTFSILASPTSISCVLPSRQYRSSHAMTPWGLCVSLVTRHFALAMPLLPQ